jgi:hypothetical protein
MKCKRCERPMTALFYSQSCDHCDGRPVVKDYGYFLSTERLMTELPVSIVGFGSVGGVVVYRERFFSSVDGLVYGRFAAAEPIKWQAGTGPMAGIQVASSLLLLYPDHRHPVGVDDRVWIDSADPNPLRLPLEELSRLHGV